MNINGNTAMRTTLRVYVGATEHGRDEARAGVLVDAIWNVLTLGEQTSIRNEALTRNLSPDTLRRHVNRFTASVREAFKAENVDAAAVMLDSEVCEDAMRAA